MKRIYLNIFIIVFSIIAGTIIVLQLFRDNKMIIFIPVLSVIIFYVLNYFVDSLYSSNK